MTGQYRGKRLFAGRHFAGRLFGPPIEVAAARGVRRVRMPREAVDAQRLRAIDEDDLLLAIAGGLVAAAGRPQ